MLNHIQVGNFEAMIHPLIPFALRGIIWHQGESNSQEGLNYLEKIKALIDGWRTAWKDRSLVFGIGQISPYDDPKLDTREQRDNWVLTQWAQYLAGKESPGIGTIILNDLATPENLHPPDKWGAGERYATWALSTVYNKGGIPGGPVVKKASWLVENRSVQLEFDYVGDGLRTIDKRDPKWFRFVGNNGVTGAYARISDDGQTVILSALSLKKCGPGLKVQHAWSNVAMPNLVNSAGYPTSLFEIPVE
jgi:sialate O-acetylesterase